MSERRSTEIKFRTTPSFKARVQAAAAAADKSMSEFLEECAETRMWAECNQKLDSSSALQEFLTTVVTPNPAEAATLTVELVDGVERLVLRDALQTDAVSTSGNEGSNVKEQPLSWMFEARQ